MVAREPGKRKMLGIKTRRVYKGDALSLKDPTALTDEIGEILEQAYCCSCCY